MGRRGKTLVLGEILAQSGIVRSSDRMRSALLKQRVAEVLGEAMARHLVEVRIEDDRIHLTFDERPWLEVLNEQRAQVTRDFQALDATLKGIELHGPQLDPSKGTKY